MSDDDNGTFLGMEDSEPKAATKAFDDKPVEKTDDSDSTSDDKSDAGE